jgi:alpha,alpha-trehalose-phosphate synthase [UDP-forming]
MSVTRSVADSEAAADAGKPRQPAGDYDFVVVASRLPVDRVDDPGSGESEWRPSPGGLVTALEPVMREANGAWVGWSGSAGDALEPFDADGMHLVTVGLSADEVRDFYEGFCNATLWPLYHDVIVPPEFRRPWWDAYVRVNRRFAEAAAGQAARGATVWVNDYQLQLVPGMLRALRGDVRIGFFNHIPFPGYEIFAQLPWRRQIIVGLLGADLMGFQRQSDATNFQRACRRAAGMTTRGSLVRVPLDLAPPALGTPETPEIHKEPENPGAPHSSRDPKAQPAREVRAAAFPVSIDSRAYSQLASSDEVRARSKEIRQALGDPEVILLGVDRLDYTKGIPDRLNAYGELLDEERLRSPGSALIQVASPSRERVEHYRVLRDEVETTVGRINGQHGDLDGPPPLNYLHQSYPRAEMAALYLAADVMLVTALRDGMNLVAKEFVACRNDESGVLVLSEFTGASDELVGALLVNPHDIDGMKDTIVRAVTMSPQEARRRMRSMRRRVFENDVRHWAATFLDALKQVPGPADLP